MSLCLASASIPSGAHPATAKLRPGDRFTLHVFSFPDLPRAYTIDSKGYVHHAILGEFRASGMTSEQLRAFLKRQLKASLRNPAFTFKVGGPSGENLSVGVLGEVAHQGKYSVGRDCRWQQVLQVAGGATEAADLRCAVVLRGDREIPLTESLEVADGDYVYVPRGLRILVSGEVAEPGMQTISRQADNSLEAAVLAAGGLTESASVSQVLITRQSLRKPIEVDLRDGPAKQRVKLEEGDVVLVRPCQCYVLGCVNRAGAYALRGEETLVGVLSGCGARGAGLNRVTVVRAGQETPEIYNLDVSLEALPIVKICDGDTIVVPDPTEPKVTRNDIERWNIPGALDLYRVFAI